MCDLTSFVQCSLLGMLMIIMGLYAFLWGSSKGKKTESPLPKSAKGEGEASTKSSDLGRSQLCSATVVPTASPVIHGFDYDDEQQRT